MSQSSDAAEFMLGKGWYTTARLSQEMNISMKFSAQLIQRVSRGSRFDTETVKNGQIVKIRVLAVDGHKAKCNQDRLWRLALFGQHPKRSNGVA